MPGPATGADEVIVDLIVAGAGSLAPFVPVKGGNVGANVWTGPVQAQGPTVPHNAIFCLETGGPPPVPDMGAAQDTFRSFSVQTMVRSNVDARAVGDTLARAVWELLDRTAAPTAPTDGYLSGGIQLLQSNPIYLGLDDTEHHKWSINASVWYKG